MATYLIDYENVHHHGLAGIDKLGVDDFVVIFVGSKDKTVPVDVAISVSKSNANILWKKSEKTAPNYLDIQLASYLGSLVGENKGDEFYIVSKDQGFVAAVDFWSPRKPNMQFVLQQTISGKLIAPANEKQADLQTQNKAASVDEKIKPSIKKKAAAILKSYNLIGGNFSMVYEIFKETKTKKQFCSAINNAYQHDKFKQLSNDLSPIFEEYLADKAGD